MMRISAVTSVCGLYALLACSTDGRTRDDEAAGGQGGAVGLGGEAGSKSTGGKGGSGGKGVSGGAKATGGSAGAGASGMSSGGGGGNGGEASGGGAGGTAGSGGSAGAGTGGMPQGGSGGMAGAPVSHAINYDFETDAENWSLVLEQFQTGMTEPVHTTDKARTGIGSLRIDVDTTMSGGVVYVGIQGRPALNIVRPVKRVTYHLWLPTDHTIEKVEAFILGFGKPEGREWESINNGKFPLVAGGWTKFVLDFAVPFPIGQYGHAIGLMIAPGAMPWQGTVYIDDVEIEMVDPTAAP